MEKKMTMIDLIIAIDKLIKRKIWRRNQINKVPPISITLLIVSAGSQPRKRSKSSNQTLASRPLKKRK